MNNATFDVFWAIEDEVRSRLGRNMELTDEVMAEITDVSFHCVFVCGDWEEESSAALLQMIVNQFIEDFPMPVTVLKDLRSQTRRPPKNPKE